MASYRSRIGSARSPWRWSGWFLLLVSLTACGVTDQGAVKEPYAAVPAPSPSTTPAPPVAEATAALPYGAEATKMPAATSAVTVHPVSTPIGQTIMSTAAVTTSSALDTPTAAGQPQGTRGPQIDLAPLLLQPGDLPANITGAQAEDPMPPNFDDIPSTATIVGLRFMREGREAGSVTVLLYDSAADLAQAYQRLTVNLFNPFTGADNATPSAPAVGEQSVGVRLALASSTYGPSQVAVITFARCQVLVDVRLNESAGLSMDQAIAYAQHLDQRVAQLTCG